MQHDFAARLAAVLSGERLAAYQNRLGQKGNLHLFAHYAWNIALGESLYPSLQMLEVALRNAIHGAACRHFQRTDWYDDAVIIHSREAEAIQKAKKTLVDARKTVEPGRVVAELSFGFWTALLDRRYEQVLWPPLLKACFPAMPRTLRTRKVLSTRFQRIRRLRNRVFHHEPVWYWRDLAQQHAEILEAVAWIEPAAQDLLRVIDRFPSVHKSGLAEIENQLQILC